MKRKHNFDFDVPRIRHRSVLNLDYRLNHGSLMIASVLRNDFSIPSPELTKLEGYDSTNFKVESNQGNYVLKQYSYSEETLALLKGENNILALLQNIGYDCPRAIPTKSGNFLLVKNGQIFRLLTFVEGEFLGDVEHTDHLLYSLGLFLGRMDKIIFNHLDVAVAAKRTPWDLQHFHLNKPLIRYIPDARNRNLVAYFFLQFNEQVYPIRHLLRQGIVHNDANDWNVLTREGTVSGIIDFGDMCKSWGINELAVALTYVMMNKERPLEAASSVLRGYHSVFALQKTEVDVLYYLIAARLCTSVCNSAYAKTLKPDSKYITISEQSAWRLLYRLLTINPLRAKKAFRKAVQIPMDTKKTVSDQLLRRKRHISDVLSLSYERPIEMHRAAFQYMYDTQGNTILDAYNNIMLAGHSHPKVVQAGQRAMARLNTNTRYLYEELLAYSEKLLSKFPPSLNKVFFVNSGSAASDLAIRIALNYTKKQKIMVLEHGYHGNTNLGIDISHYKYAHQGGTGRSNFVLEAPLPNALDSGFEDDGTAGKHFARRTASKIETHIGEIAAFIAEPIVGCGGQVPLAKGYLQEIYPQIRAQGGLCISDEVQVGFGRLGASFWGFQIHNVVPDIVVLGKPMGNGHPIGAVVTTAEVAERFDNGLEFFSSFGGNPVSCAIGLAVLEVIEEEKLQLHAKVTGTYLESLLNRLKTTYPQIRDVRGSGLFLGVELVDAHGRPATELAARLKNGLREKNILLGTDGPYDNVLKIKPPLSFQKKNCDELVEAINITLSEIVKK